MQTRKLRGKLKAQVGKRMVLCEQCKERKVHSRNKCKNCYERWYYHNNEKYRAYHKQYSKIAYEKNKDSERLRLRKYSQLISKIKKSRSDMIKSLSVSELLALVREDEDGIK